MNRESKKYIKSIEKALVGTNQQKQEFLKNISSAVDEYCEENSNASYNDICLRFGEPDVIAKELICDTDINQIKKKVGVKKIIAAGLAIMVVLLVALFVAEYVDSHNEAHGYANTGISNISDESGASVASIE